MRRTIYHMLGLWTLLFSSVLLPPLAISALYRDGETAYFALALAGSLGIAGAFRLAAGGRPVPLKKRDGFVVVVVLWFFTGLLGGAYLMGSLALDPAAALFEAVSALTTTGATVITGLDRLPPSVLFLRQELQWIGGIGVVVSAIAMLPLLGIGGTHLFTIEAPGPMKGEKLTPRIAHTAVLLLKLYLALTVCCALAYWFGGMTVFDAIAHSFSTVSTGGFSTHDASFAYFDSAVIESIAVVFMLLGAINFGVHFSAWRTLSVEPYWNNLEVRVFLGVVTAVGLLVAAQLYLHTADHSAADAVRVAGFTVVSVITSTGFGTESFAAWPTFLPLLLILISFVGGCGGSTAGGMKVLRFVIFIRVVGKELFRLIHPQAVQRLKVGSYAVSHRDASGVMAFFIAYVLIFFLFVLIMLAWGMDFVTAFSAVATCINNLGPGLGAVAGNFQTVPDGAKLVFALIMLMGRLEIFALLVLLSPGYWRG